MPNVVDRDLRARLRRRFEFLVDGEQHIEEVDTQYLHLFADDALLWQQNASDKSAIVDGDADCLRYRA